MRICTKHLESPPVKCHEVLGEQAVASLERVIGASDIEQLRALTSAMSFCDKKKDRKQCVTLLTGLLRNRNDDIVSAAAQALQALGDDAVSAIPALEAQKKRKNVKRKT